MSPEFKKLKKNFFYNPWVNLRLGPFLQEGQKQLRERVGGLKGEMNASLQRIVNSPGWQHTWELLLAASSDLWTAVGKHRAHFTIIRPLSAANSLTNSLFHLTEEKSKHSRNTIMVRVFLAEPLIKKGQRSQKGGEWHVPNGTLFPILCTTFDQSPMSYSRKVPFEIQTMWWLLTGGRTHNVPNVDAQGAE